MRLKQRSDTNHCSFYKYHEDAVRITDWSCWRDVNRDQKEGVVPAGGAAGLEQGGGWGEDWWDSSRVLKASLRGLLMKWMGRERRV